MAAIHPSSFFQRRKLQYAQYGPPWSASLWIAAFVASLLDHFFCSSLHQQDVSRSSPSYVASVQRIFALLIELCLMCSNTAVMFHIIYRSSRRKPDITSLPSYIAPIITFLLLTFINVALIAVPMIAPAALVAMTLADSSSLAYYHYSPSLLLLTYGVGLSLVALSIAAGTVLSWGFGQTSEELPSRDELLGLNWDGHNGERRE
ncbi:hypothetical protein FRC08_018290 [Ceratobasidium sp. 394]|nr:hypothetical protein FRC08_018290 [Ceratobasidium sp. 394]